MGSAQTSYGPARVRWAPPAHAWIAYDAALVLAVRTGFVGSRPGHDASLQGIVPVQPGREVPVRLGNGLGFPRFSHPSSGRGLVDLIIGQAQGPEITPSRSDQFCLVARRLSRTWPAGLHGRGHRVTVPCYSSLMGEFRDGPSVRLRGNRQPPLFLPAAGSIPTVHCTIGQSLSGPCCASSPKI